MGIKSYFAAHVYHLNLRFNVLFLPFHLLLQNLLTHSGDRFTQHMVDWVLALLLVAEE